MEQASTEDTCPICCESEDTCPICCESIATSPVALPCGHKFHGACITTWLWEKQSCPNCRIVPEHVESESSSEYSSDSSEYSSSESDDELSEQLIQNRKDLIANAMRRKFPIRHEASKLQSSITRARDKCERLKEQLSTLQQEQKNHNAEKRLAVIGARRNYRSQLRIINDSYNPHNSQLRKNMLSLQKKIRNRDRVIELNSDKLLTFL